MARSVAAPANNGRAELRDVMRGIAGGMLFGVPLLFTMEMFWIGRHTTAWQMLLVLIMGFVTVLALNLTGGFRSEDEPTLSGALRDSVEALAIGLVAAGAVLLLFNQIRSGMTMSTLLGGVVYEAAPFAIGVSLARNLLSGERSNDDKPSGRAGHPAVRPFNQTVADLGAAAVGALFLAMSIAPTEEVPMLAAEMGAVRLTALIPASLLITYVIVFASGFGDTDSRHLHEGILQTPLIETVVAYAIALLISLVLLLLFQQVTLADPMSEIARRTLVLGLPAAIGGAAGRLAV